MSARRRLPETLARRLRRVRHWPPVGFVRFGTLRRGTPLNRAFGIPRGTPVDRFYIDQFFHRHAGAEGYAPGAIRGTVLEVGEDRYASRFALPGAIERLDVLHATPGNPDATVVGDLTDPASLPDRRYDCVICTQTLLLVYDVRTAVRSLHELLVPGGVVLATMPGISQICRPDMDAWGDYWRFTSLSARRLFEEVFDPADVVVESFGNVLSATAFLYGLAAEDLRRRELELNDPDYQVTVAVKATRSARTPRSS